LRGVDDVHQYAALPFLRSLFDDDVLAPIQLHVDAKRTCARRAPTTSTRCPPTPSAAWFCRAVSSPRIRPRRSSRSRRRRTPCACGWWDDLAKVEGAVTPPLARYVATLEAAQRTAVATLDATPR
jgi:predicted HD phosphohydrolase